MSKDKWGALSAQERAQLINIYVQEGITDLDTIKNDYNSYEDGGTIEEYSVPFPKDDDINTPYRSVITADMRENFITKSKNKFDTFVNKMYPIVERSLLDAGHSTDNLNNILRQMAQESNYGLSPRGNGYNLSGIKAWNDKEGTKHKDGYYYRNFDDYKDYADYHVALLNNRYNALDAKDTKDFVYRLHHTKDGRKYSGDERGYRRNLRRMSSLDNAIEKFESNTYAKGGRILDGSTENSQTLSGDTIEESNNYIIDKNGNIIDLTKHSTAKGMKDKMSRVLLRQGAKAFDLGELVQSFRDNISYIKGDIPVIEGIYNGMTNHTDNTLFYDDGSQGDPVDIYISGNYNKQLYKKVNKKPRTSLKSTLTLHKKELPTYQVIGIPDTIKLSNAEFRKLKEVANNSNNTTLVHHGYFNKRGASQDATASVFDAGDYSEDWSFPNDSTIVSTPYDVFDFTNIGKDRDLPLWKELTANMVGKILDKNYNPYIMEGVPTVFIKESKK